MFLKVIILILTLAAVEYDCANILAIVPTPSYSHQIALWPLWMALSEKGHNVTLITTDPKPEAKNITQLDISFGYEIMKKLDITNTVTKNNNNFFAMVNKFIEVGFEMKRSFFTSDIIQNFIHTEGNHYDVVLAEVWDTSIIGFARKFNAPFIGVSTLDIHFMAHECMGNPTHPALYPEPLLPFFGELSLVERIISTSYILFMRYLMSSVFVEEHKIMKQYLSEDLPYPPELLCDMDMLFINVNPVFHFVRPMVPAAINIGGGLHIQKPKPLPKDLQNYLDSSPEGVIYFSLGSNVKSADLTQKEKSAILETFSELPYKVLWKFEADELPGKSDNVKIMKWLPQQDILRHPNVKLFITQGGLQSIDEAIYNKVPMVGIPFFGDQQTNVRKLELKGIAKYIDHFTMEKDTFKSAVLEVINNPSYRNKIQQLSDLTLDKPMSGLDQAVWWTEYVIRHKGAKHLKGAGVNIPWYQYYLLDVIGVVSAVLIAIFFVIYKTVKFSYRCGKNLICKMKCQKKKVQ